MTNFSDLVKEHNIVILNNKRFYREDLTKRDFYLENTRPEYFKIGYDEFIESSWGKLLQDVANYLISEYDLSEEDLSNFKSEWTKQKIFIKKQNMSSSQILDNGMYINTNHTALHSCWLLQDLLKFCNIDLKDVELIIHKMPIAEPKDVINCLREFNKEEFAKYLENKLKKSEIFIKKAEKVINYIDNYIEKKFPSYISIYLFDDSVSLASIKSKIIQDMEQTGYVSGKNLETFKFIFGIYYKYLVTYYK